MRIVVAADERAESIHRLRPVLDTGADHTAFDGTVGLYLGWTEPEIAGRALDARPIYGAAAGERPAMGYLHELTCFIPLGRQYAQLQLRVFLTPPNTLWTPVLGRRDFFEQVDFALVEAERRFYLRFRDPRTRRGAW